MLAIAIKIGLSTNNASTWAHVASFVVVSGGLVSTAHSIVHSCHGLVSMIDSFCLQVGVRHLAVEDAVRNWNLVQVWRTLVARVASLFIERL